MPRTTKIYSALEGILKSFSPPALRGLRTGRRIRLTNTKSVWDASLMSGRCFCHSAKGLLASLCVFVFLFYLGGCSRKQPVGAQKSSGPSPHQLNSVEEIPSKLREQMDECAEKLESAFADGDSNLVINVFDRTAIVDAIFEGIDLRN